MDPFIGQITMFAGNFAPRGWAFCEGQLLPISQNQALFSILGTTYGGDGRTSFGLPDLRGRVPIQQGTGPGLTNRPLGSKGGAETVTLTTAQIPAHNHLAQCSQTRGNNPSPESRFPAVDPDEPWIDTTDSSTMNRDFIAPAGEGQAHPNMQPFLAINFIIALQGIFPSRN